MYLVRISDLSSDPGPPLHDSLRGSVIGQLLYSIYNIHVCIDIHIYDIIT